METLLAKHGLEKDTSIRRYTDYREMIEAEQPTLAAIATESGIHAEIALYCIAHGVNVIIEKPMAMSMADADTIPELMAMSGVTYQKPNEQIDLLMVADPSTDVIIEEDE